jgi:ATP-dependent DNA helicase RecQ
MQMYAELRDCRRQYLLEYFGEDANPCGECDSCRRGLPAARSDAGAEPPFPLHTRDVHRKLGKGVVVAYDGDAIRVVFDEHGEKSLRRDLVLGRGLIERAGRRD